MGGERVGFIENPPGDHAAVIDVVGRDCCGCRRVEQGERAIPTGLRLELLLQSVRGQPKEQGRQIIPGVLLMGGELAYVRRRKPRQSQMGGKF